MTTTHPKELERPQLIHLWSWSDKPEEFLKEIEKTGGWPEQYKYVSFFHDTGDGRYCKFGNQFLNTGWWTTVATSDDYYYFKLSDKKKEEILNKAKKELIKQLQ